MIELLVVIAIIILLVSILVPSLSRAQEMARTAICASNLRQGGQLWMAFASENRQMYPAPWDPHVPSYNSYNWRYQWPYIAGYIYNPSLEIPNPYTPAVGDNACSKENTPLLFCPSVTRKGGMNSVYFNGVTDYSYAIMARDWRFPVGSSYRGQYGVGGYPRLQAIGNPGMIFHLADAAGTFSELPNENIFFNYDGARSEPHNFKSNYLFVDGHAENMSQEEEVEANFQSDGPEFNKPDAKVVWTMPPFDFYRMN